MRNALSAFHGGGPDEIPQSISKKNSKKIPEWVAIFKLLKLEGSITFRILITTNKEGTD